MHCLQNRLVNPGPRAVLPPASRHKLLCLPYSLYRATRPDLLFTLSCAKRWLEAFRLGHLQALHKDGESYKRWHSTQRLTLHVINACGCCCSLRALLRAAKVAKLDGSLCSK